MNIQDKNAFPVSKWIRFPFIHLSNRNRNVPPALHTFFRRSFNLARMPESAVLKISADDFAKLYVNGTLAWLGPAPGYLHRYYYARIDIRPFLQEGANTLAVHSYYQGLVNRVWNSGDDLYGIIAELELKYPDGSSEKVVSDYSWRCFRCDAYRAERKIGYDTQFSEDIDQRLIPAGWRRTSFADSSWIAPECVPDGTYPHKMVLQETPSLEFGEIKPVMWKVGGVGALLYDFGREIVGSAVIKLDVPAGTLIEVRHAEELDNLGRAKFRLRANCDYQEFCTTSASGEPIEFFDYKGFRYMWLIGNVDPLTANVSVISRHYPFNDSSASFESSDTRLNGIWEICRQAVKVGTQDSYLDCPTREKGAYLGDAVVTGLAHLHLTGDSRIMKKVLSDFAASAVYCPGLKAVAPGAFMQDIADYSLMWIPLLREYYMWTGDIGFVKEMLPVARGVVDYFRKHVGQEGLIADFTAKPVMADWPGNLRDEYDDLGLMGSVSKQKGMNTLLNIYYVITLDAASFLMAAAGEKGESESLSANAESVRKAILKNMSRGGVLADTAVSSHTALHPNALALFCGLEPEEGWNGIVELVRQKRLKCGVFFSYFLLRGLYNIGEFDLAYDLMTCDDERSWMTMIKAGGTTCMEAWGPEQKWNTSLCHPWAAAPVIMTASELFGLRPLEPGWGKIALYPQIPRGLERASMHMTVPQGRVSASFVQKGDELEFTVDIPAGCELSHSFQTRFTKVSLNGRIL